jgi:hypothetical protein
VEEVSREDTEWLSLVKYQLLVAREQTRLSQPLNALGLNMVQDAVESALALVIQSRGGDLRSKADFLQLFDAAICSGSDPEVLRVFRPAMGAMNNARVAFKHHGNVADSAVISRHVERSAEFVSQLVEQVFGLEMSEISLLAFLRSEEAQAILTDAEALWNAGDGEMAMEKLRLAFDIIVKDFTSRKVWSPGTSIFTTKPSFYPSVFDLRDAGSAVEKMDKWLQNLDQWVRYSALGVNMLQYAYFNVHAPVMTYTLDGSAHPHWREGVAPTQEAFTRCFKFVVDTGISLAREDFDFDAWSARWAADPPGPE